MSTDTTMTLGEWPVQTEGARRFLATPDRRMLIGAEWVDALSGDRLETLNPATGELLATIPAGDAADVDRAVAIARAAFEQGPEYRDVHVVRLGARGD